MVHLIKNDHTTNNRKQTRRLRYLKIPTRHRAGSITSSSSVVHERIRHTASTDSPYKRGFPDRINLVLMGISNNASNQVEK